MTSLTVSVQERRRIRTVFLAVFFWGLLAHAYAFLNFTISHDSMNEFDTFQQMGYYAGTAADWKIALGRFLCPAYQLIFRGETVSPWFSGTLALFWAALAVWATAHVFDIQETPLLVVLSGIFTVNLSAVALTASYLHDLDADLFAALAAVCAVLCWKKGGKICLAAIPLLLVTLGIYQSMLSVYICFVIFLSILHLRDGRDCKSVFLDGLQAVVLMAAAGILYYIVSKLVCALCGLELTSQENGVANMLGQGTGILSLLISTYWSWLEAFLLSPPRTNALWNLCLFLACGWFLLDLCRKKDLSVGAKLLALALTAILPLGMNVAAFLNNGISHLLMLYAAWFLYLLILLLARRQKKQIFSCLCLILVILVLLSNVRFANSLYPRKQMEREAAHSLMTRVLDRIEQEPGYVPGETEVAILGHPDLPQLPGYSQTYEIIGAMVPSPITDDNFYSAYFTYLLPTSIRLCDSQRREEIRSQLSAPLPAFPSAGCLTWVGDTLVLNMR